MYDVSAQGFDECMINVHYYLQLTNKHITFVSIFAQI